MQVEVGSAGSPASFVPGPVESARRDGLAVLSSEEPSIGPSVDVPLQVLRNQRCNVAGDGDGAAASFGLG
jgi:hypothetical protein